MENPIYIRYRNFPTGFDTTLGLIQELLSERLSSDYRRIFVQASNSNRVNFCFTLFFKTPRYNELGGFYCDYQIVTQEVKNFRNWRPDGNLEQEISQIESLIKNLSTNSLLGFLN